MWAVSSRVGAVLCKHCCGPGLQDAVLTVMPYRLIGSRWRPWLFLLSVTLVVGVECSETAWETSGLLLFFKVFLSISQYSGHS